MTDIERAKVVAPSVDASQQRYANSLQQAQPGAAMDSETALTLRKTIRYRDHRGGLAESMETMIEVATKGDIVRHLREADPAYAQFDMDTLAVEPYGDGGPDDRIGWPATWIVTINGKAIGFTDGPVPEGAVLGAALGSGTVA